MGLKRLGAYYPTDNDGKTDKKAANLAVHRTYIKGLMFIIYFSRPSAEPFPDVQVDGFVWTTWKWVPYAECESVILLEKMSQNWMGGMEKHIKDVDDLFLLL